MTAPLFDIIDRMEQEVHSSRMGVIFAAAGTGPQLRDAAMQKVLAKKPSQIYKGHLEWALFSFTVGSLFTVEQLTAIAGRPPEGVHFNSVGAIVRGMATRGLIEKTGRMIQATRSIMHATELAEWRLLKYPERPVNVRLREPQGDA